MFLSGKSTSSAAAEKPFSIDPVPYKTSRISSTEFRYTFEVNPGQKFIRLHFYPASYRGFENSVDFFTVKAGPFTLLGNFSASLTAETLGVKYHVKEFCLNVNEKGTLSITFLPSLVTKSNLNVYAFVNGIEIISMPTGLYYTPDGVSGACVVGLNNQFRSIDNSTALELTHRLKIGGSFISSIEDLGMFRRWSEDTNYLLESGVHQVNHQVHRIKYAHMPAFIAPPKLYQTSWKKGGNIRANQMYNFTWKIPLELGFGYLIRLHFCELDDGMAEREQRDFSVLINNHIAETQADVIRWSGGNGVPVYRDYMVKMEGDKGGGRTDLLIVLQSLNKLVLGLLNGVEIFKLSNVENSLATPNLTFPKRLSASWNLRTRNLFLGFGQNNVIMTGMTILITLVNVIVYNLRQIWEEKFHLEKDTQADRAEPSYHRFSLAEIKSATQNFSDAFVIGRGGFGKVYKGFIHGISADVAIKRLCVYSRQGAREFWTEIETLSKLRHVHLVSLLGYCNEDQEMILVYEYMPCGTLADHLYKLTRKGKAIAPLSWQQRLKICIGAARGMEYLHIGTKCAVIHRDVKDSNILLDENFVAKISDFGLSKLEHVTQSKSYVSTKVKGTPGYWDPEYVMTRRLTRKSDVYSFGVVLLVVLSGKPAVGDRNHEEPQSLLSCFRECITEGNVDRIIDPSLQGKFSSNSLSEFLKCIENCIHHLSKKRPTMTQVILRLEKALEQQECPMISASKNATIVGQEEVPVNGENAVTAPEEGIRKLSTQNPYSMIGGTGLQSSQTNHARVPKSSWNWPWKAWKTFWNRGEEEPEVHHSAAAHLGKLKQFSLRELQVATNNFSNQNILGRGGFGNVYRGQLADGSLVAVKRMKEEHTQGGEWQFQTEVEITSMAIHRNLLRLRGFCMTPTERMLVYPYMVNGSVASCLRERPETGPPLDWPMRKRIALESARGLAHLNDHCGPKIIHRNVKAASILLDDKFKAVVGDFRLAKLMDYEDSDVTTAIRGTTCHIAPEYISTGKCSEKTDVFGYGIMLLELITGQRAFDLARLANDEDVMLLDWVEGHLREEMLETLVDTNLKGDYVIDEVVQLMLLSLLCTQSSPTERPKMSEVVRMLEGSGLAKRWEDWQKEDMFRQELNHIHHPNTDSVPNLLPEKLPGPRDDARVPKTSSNWQDKRRIMAQLEASLDQPLEQLESPMSAASRNAIVVGQLELPSLGENVIPSPEEDITSKLIQNPYSLNNGNKSTQNPFSPTTGNDLQSRMMDNSRVPKPSWNWPWTAVWNRGKKQKDEVSFLKSKLQELPVHVYSYNTLANATNNFHSENTIGMGAFGQVYKGILFGGQEISVRRHSSLGILKFVSEIGIAEFMNEIEVHSRLQHPNIVKLLGCCAEREESMLVYEYIPYSKSLDFFLFDPTNGYLLDWDRRAIIIKGIGKGLLYLHQDSSLKIIHRNVRPSNILLDEKMNPKISDFSMARIFEGCLDETDTTRVVGTYGYMDPEYCMTGKVSEKSDVYSYGVLLLEIISGKRNAGFIFDDDKNETRLVEYAWKLWNGNETMNFVDPKLCGTCNEMQIQRYVHVALLCVQVSAIDRPDMSTVLSMLNCEITELPQPKFSSYEVRSYRTRRDSSESECSQETGHSVTDGPYPTDWVTF
ncbi:hypothetical protein ACH5RR_016431 [Cinchona calisaya]|uniref:non-specific serine/threonine protein kinase n=1 Tax=Cinchona calisaya TaxID=153742 RepID=A0ABD2ZYL9_9GENT